MIGDCRYRAYVVTPLHARGRDRLETTEECCDNLVFPYSLGDAIDWKPLVSDTDFLNDHFNLLLARGRDRLETSIGDNG